MTKKFTKVSSGYAQNGTEMRTCHSHCKLAPSQCSANRPSSISVCAARNSANRSLSTDQAATQPAQRAESSGQMTTLQLMQHCVVRVASMQSPSQHGVLRVAGTQPPCDHGATVSTACCEQRARSPPSDQGSTVCTECCK